MNTRSSKRSVSDDKSTSKTKRVAKEDTHQLVPKVPRINLSRDLQNTHPIKQLPAEVLEIILSRILETDFSTALTARLVCRDWNNAIRTNLSYSGTLTDGTIRSLSQLDPTITLKKLTISALQNSRITYSSTPRYGDVSNPVKFDPLLFRRSVEHLIVGGEAALYLNKFYDGNLQYSLSTGFAEEQHVLSECSKSISGADLCNIIPQIRDVQTLTLSSIAFLSVSKCALRKLDFQHFSTLTKLDICVGKKTEEYKLAAFLKKVEFSSLSSLYLRLYHGCVNFYLYVCIVEFIARHYKSLKNLSFCQAQAYYVISPMEVNNSKFTICGYPKIRERLLTIKLDYMRMDCLVFGHPLGDEWKQLEWQFIKNQTQLRGLELQMHLRAMKYRLEQIIPACEDTLQRLEITTYHCYPNNFDCAILSAFKKLETCHLFLNDNVVETKEEPRTYVENLKLLPSLLVSLHLGQLLTKQDIYILHSHLHNLEKISYSYSGAKDTETSTKQWILPLIIFHLKFVRLTEIRIYHFDSIEVVDALNVQIGLYSYIDEGSLLVFIDREEIRPSQIPSIIDSICKQLN